MMSAAERQHNAKEIKFLSDFILRTVTFSTQIEGSETKTYTVHFSQPFKSTGICKG